MIRTQLTMALDFRARKGVPHEVRTYQKDGQWFIVQSGPKYSNTLRVVEYDDQGLAELKKYEQPLPTTPPPR